MKPFLIAECYPKLKGWGYFAKQDVILQRILFTEAEQHLYSVYKYVMTDWDSRHAKHAHFVYDQRNIQYFTGWSESKIARVHRGLKSIGCICLIDAKVGLYELVGYELIQKLRKSPDTVTLNTSYGYLKLLLDLFATHSNSTIRLSNANEQLSNMIDAIPNLNKVDGIQPVTTGLLHSKYSVSLVSSNDVYVSDDDFHSPENIKAINDSLPGE